MPTYPLPEASPWLKGEADGIPLGYESCSELGALFFFSSPFVPLFFWPLSQTLGPSWLLFFASLVQEGPLLFCLFCFCIFWFPVTMATQDFIIQIYVQH